MAPNINKTQSAFTIVELLIVIVVIAILAAISLVAFNGVQTRAVTAVLESDLGSASKQLKLFKADKGVFPVTISTDCATSPTSDTNLCIKPSGDNVVENYTSPSPYTTFSLTIKHVASGLNGTVTDSSSPVVSAGAAGDGGEDGIKIGDQVWAAKNVNTGVMITGDVEQTNNGTVEKYCFKDNEANCEKYGALYMRNEAFQYRAVSGTQGVCMEGWHIPTDEEWKTLELNLGMSQDQVDKIGNRGVDQGEQMREGGSSGLHMPLGGYRATAFSFEKNYAKFHTSTYANRYTTWHRQISSVDGRVERSYHFDNSRMGFAVRCLKD